MYPQGPATCQAYSRHSVSRVANLDNILKIRGILLPTKVHLVKAIVFHVVMYGCECWTVKKAERRRIELLNCGIEDS